MRNIDELVEKLHSLTADELLANKAALHWISYGLDACGCGKCPYFLGKDVVVRNEDGSPRHCPIGSDCEEGYFEYMTKEKDK